MQLYNSLLETHPDGSADPNAIVNGNWTNLGAMFNPAEELTASQSGTTVTASTAVFTSDDVGATIRFANGTTRVIASFTDTDEVEVTVAGAVASQEFELYRTTLVARDALMRGLTKQTRMLAGDDTFYFYWDTTRKRLVRGSMSQDSDGNITQGDASAPQGTRMIARAAHTASPTGVLSAGQWDLTVVDDGGTPYFLVRYYDGSVTHEGVVPLAPAGSS